MQNLTYPAVFEPSADGSYSIYFPDLPGCISVGDNLEEAARMAAQAASLHVYSMECDNEKVPAPSVNLSKEDTEGNVIMPVTIHPDLFRMKKLLADTALHSKDKEADVMPVIELIEHERITYIKEMEDYLHNLKKLPKEQAGKISKENLVKSNILKENGEFTDFYKCLKYNKMDIK